MFEKIIIILVFIIIGVLASRLVRAQYTFIITDVPKDTPAEDTIYIAGDFNGWKPAHRDYAFTRRVDGSYKLVLKVKQGKYNYKITRGSWETCQADKNHGKIPNQVLQLGLFKKKKLSVAGWQDFGIKTKEHTAEENVSIISEEFEMPQLGKKRRIWLYLPPDYETSNKNYPVLYMHDGQNVFDDYYSFSGEWDVDGSLNKLFKKGDSGVIVVAIDNGGKERLDEYSPWKSDKHGGGQGKEYVDFLVETLKPHIDKNYRTKPEREHTGIMGSSMGGLISFYAMLQYPDVFSKGGVFSPSFWFSDKSYAFAKTHAPKEDFKMYILAGEKESKELVKNVNKMQKILIDAGCSEDMIKIVPKADGEHSEWFWRREFPDAYNWLFDK